MIPMHRPSRRNKPSRAGRLMPSRCRFPSSTEARPRAGFSHLWRCDMADYYSPTVIQQTIPEADMTPLERLILTHIFDADTEDGGLYFYSEQGPSDVVSVLRADLVEALTASRNQKS